MSSNTINPCEICHKNFFNQKELISHYLNSVNHPFSDLNSAIEDKNMRKILRLPIQNKSATANFTQHQQIFPQVQTGKEIPNIFQSGVAANSGSGSVKFIDGSSSNGKVVRKCEICSMEVDGSYQKYVLHALQNHNPKAAQSFVKDSYILEGILSGGVSKKKKCDICSEEISKDVYDYIIHIQKNHKEQINNSLRKHVPDEYVLSILFKKNLYSSDKTLFQCNRCGEEVEMNDWKEHSIQHKLEKEAYNNFYGLQSAKNNYTLNNHLVGVQATTDIFQQKIKIPSNCADNNFSNNSNSNSNNNSQKSTVKCYKCGREIAYKDLNEHNLQHKQEKMKNKNINGGGDGSNQKPGNEQKIQTDGMQTHQKIFGNNSEKKDDNIHSTNNTPKTTVTCYKCGKELEYKDLKEHNLQHKQEKYSNKNANGKTNSEKETSEQKPPNQQNIKDDKAPEKQTKSTSTNSSNKDVIDNTSSNQKSTSTKCFKCGKEVEYKDLKEHNLQHKQEKLNKNTNENKKDITKTSDSNLNNGDLLSNLVNILSSTNTSNNININFNINTNNHTTTNNSISNNTITNNNNSDNSEEFKKLQGEVSQLKLNLETLESNQSKSIEEHKKLQKFISEKMIEKDFKMSQIENEVKRLSELESQIKDTNGKIDQLTGMKEEYDKKFQQQDEKIGKMEDNLKSQILELEKQYQFLNSQTNNSFADKLNEVEKNLIKLKLKSESSEVDFTKPSTWTIQNENLSMITINSTTQEFSKISQHFLKTMAGYNVTKITRIQNLELWKNFCFSKYQLTKKGNATSKLLFHGTRDADPSLIFSGKEEGFDMRFAAAGMWGTGIYFHENASYSNDYRYTNKNLSNSISSTKTYSMFCAEVLVGDFVIKGSDRTIRLPPFKDEVNKLRYDSVKSSNDGIYIVYNNMRAYPSYMIEYK